MDPFETSGFLIGVLWGLIIALLPLSLGGLTAIFATCFLALLWSAFVRNPDYPDGLLKRIGASLGALGFAFFGYYTAHDMFAHQITWYWAGVIGLPSVSAVAALVSFLQARLRRSS